MVYGKSSSCVRTGSRARRASLPWPISRRPAPRMNFTSPTEKVVGSSATYDIDKAVLVVRGGGKPVIITTPTDQVIANDTLEYWETRRQAVARGGAKAIREDVPAEPARPAEPVPDGDAPRIEVRRDIQEARHGDYRLRRTTIDEVLFDPADPEKARPEAAGDANDTPRTDDEAR